MARRSPISKEESLVKSEKSEKSEKKETALVFSLFDQENAVHVVDKDGKESPSLSKSILNLLNGPKDNITRLAFERDPFLYNEFFYIYKAKQRLLPDSILKRMSVQDDLVSSIIMHRQGHMSNFFRPRYDRHGKGYVIEPEIGVTETLTPAQNEELTKRIAEAAKKLETCGNPQGFDKNKQVSFCKWGIESVKQALSLGRIAIEIIWTDTLEGTKKFHSFRGIDVGTIYEATKQKGALDAVRQQSVALLQKISNKRLVPERFMNDEYAYVQVVDGRPIMAFTEDECIVHNFYPVLDIEMEGYPVTPLDTIWGAVTTHINIGTHNRLFFENGRASRGMIVINSDNVNQHMLDRIRQNFQANINGSSKSWRLPVFGVNKDEKVTWMPIDTQGRDMEFQYLTDQNARVIFSAFQVSPEEIQGWAYLSKGTNSQSLSESNNEFSTLAARDVGIRPLMAQFEDIVNAHLLPLIDPWVASLCRFRMMGLDADSAEKEGIRLQQDAPLHYTYDQILKKVEKKPVSRAFGGDYPLNPTFQAVLDKFFTVGQQKAYFTGDKSAEKDPELNYYAFQYWFEFKQLQLSMQQAQQAASMAAQSPPPGSGGGGSSSSGGSEQSAPEPGSGENSNSNPPQQMAEQPEPAKNEPKNPEGTNQLSKVLDTAMSHLSKP